jgi:hypothetical protein
MDATPPRASKGGVRILFNPGPSLLDGPIQPFLDQALVAQSIFRSIFLKTQGSLAGSPDASRDAIKPKPAH